jgi:hypothetical protein
MCTFNACAELQTRHKQQQGACGVSAVLKIHARNLREEHRPIGRSALATALSGGGQTGGSEDARRTRCRCRCLPPASARANRRPERNMTRAASCTVLRPGTEAHTTQHCIHPAQQSQDSLAAKARPQWIYSCLLHGRPEHKSLTVRSQGSCPATRPQLLGGTLPRFARYCQGDNTNSITVPRHTRARRDRWDLLKYAISVDRLRYRA